MLCRQVENWENKVDQGSPWYLFYELTKDTKCVGERLNPRTIFIGIHPILIKVGNYSDFKQKINKRDHKQT